MQKVLLLVVVLVWLCAAVGGGTGLWFVGCVLMVAVLDCGLLVVCCCWWRYWSGCVLLLVAVLDCGLLVVC